MRYPVMLPQNRRFAHKYTHIPQWYATSLPSSFDRKQQHDESAMKRRTICFHAGVTVCVVVVLLLLLLLQQQFCTSFLRNISLLTMGLKLLSPSYQVALETNAPINFEVSCYTSKESSIRTKVTFKQPYVSSVHSFPPLKDDSQSKE